MNKADEEAPVAAEQIRQIETDRQYRSIRFTPDGKTLICAAYDGSIQRWDLAAEEPQLLDPLLEHQGWAEAVLFAPACDRMLTTDSWGKLCGWDLTKPTPTIAWKHDQAHDGWIRSASLSADETMLVTAGRDCAVRIWDTKTGEQLDEFVGHEHDVFSAALHPAGNVAVSADSLGNLKHWDRATGKCLRTVRLEDMHYFGRDQDVAGIYSLAFTADGKQLIAAGSQPTRTSNVGGTPVLQWLDWKTLKVAKTITFGEEKQGYVHDYAIHADGYVMVVTSGTPGAGQFLCQRLDEEEPFFITTKMSNCHGLAFDATSNRCIVAATNRNSQGNGVVLNADGDYRGNTSPLHLFQLAESTS